MNTNNAKKILIAATFAVALPAGVSFGQNSGIDETPQVVIPGNTRDDSRGSAYGDAAGQGMIGQDERNMTDAQKSDMAKKFFEYNASGNQFEIESAQLAQKNASDQQVKQIATTIERDHKTALQALRRQAEDAGVKIAEEPKLNKVHSETLSMLKQKQGKEFDAAYVFQQDSAHLLKVLVLNHAEQSNMNPNIAAYASEVLPAVKGHHADLHALANEMSGYNPEGAAVAGGQMGDMGDPDMKADEKKVEEYFKHAAVANAYEIETAKLAEERSSDPQIKQIAQTKISDHQQAMQALQRQAEMADVKIDDEPKLDALHKAKLDMLKEKKGSDFDRAYVFGSAAGHRMGLLGNSYAMNKMGSQPVKSFAQTAISAEQKHFAEVKPLASRMAGGVDLDAMGEGGMNMGGMNGRSAPMPTPTNPENRKDADSTGDAADGPEADGDKPRGGM